MNKWYGNLDLKIILLQFLWESPRKSDRATNLKKERGKTKKKTNQELQGTKESQTKASREAKELRERYLEAETGAKCERRTDRRGRWRRRSDDACYYGAMEQRRETVDKEARSRVTRCSAGSTRSFNSKHLPKQCFLNKPSPNLGVSNLTTWFLG